MVNGGNAPVQGLSGRVEFHFLPFEQVTAFIGRVNAGQGLDQSRFTRAVVAQQAMHLAVAQAQGDAVQGNHRAKELADVFQLKNVLTHTVSPCDFQRLPKVKRLRMKLLKITAISSISPRKTRYQLLSMLV